MGIVSQWWIYIVKFWTRVHRSDQFSSFSCSFRQILAFRIGAPSLENSGSAAVSGLLPPATKLGQGYVFTGVCDSVHRGGRT